MIKWNRDFWFLREMRESEEITLSSWLLLDYVWIYNDLLGIKKYTSKMLWINFFEFMDMFLLLIIQQ